jgi:hypothetical protein
VDKQGLDMLIEDCGLALLLVGTVQSLYEKALGLESAAEWELSDDGAIRIKLKAKQTA